jgi:transcriptional regulator with XRE-family HTH domain
VTKQVWLPVDGALLKKLREEAGLEIITLARLHSLSTSQVSQLENGGDSSFYTPSIKLATGRKLLMHFGADVQPLEQAPEQNFAKALDVIEKDIETAPTTFVQSESWNGFFQLKALSAVLVFILLLYSVYFQSLPVTEKEPVTVGRQTTSTSPVAEMASVAKTIGSTISRAGEIPKESPPECKWVNEPTLVFRSPPSKPGNYVHVIADSDGSVCVKDAADKLQVVHLSSKQSQTIRGKPPFEIFSNNLNEFKIFYQGNLVRLPNSRTQNITLKEEKYE